MGFGISGIVTRGFLFSIGLVVTTGYVSGNTPPPPPPAPLQQQGGVGLGRDFPPREARILEIQVRGLQSLEIEFRLGPVRVEIDNTERDRRLREDDDLLGRMGVL